MCITTPKHTYSQTYTAGNCQIDCRVNCSWDNNQDVNVTVTNVGTEIIDNWAIKYNATGEINNLWNGQTAAMKAQTLTHLKAQI